MALGYDVLEVKSGFKFKVRGLFCGEVGPEFFGCIVVGGDRVLSAMGGGEGGWALRGGGDKGGPQCRCGTPTCVWW